MGAYLWGLAAKTAKNGQKLRNGFVKRGGIFGPHQIFFTFLDSEFNLDLDFAIKHDLIL